MEVLIAKMANHFAVRFERYGSVRPLTVVRITRPHLLRYDEYCPDSVAPIEVDLLDDVHDLARSETLLQLRRQSHGEFFHIEIDTYDADKLVAERWRLEQCRIVDCRFNELTNDGGKLYVRLQVQPQRVLTNIHAEMTLICESCCDHR